MNSLAKLYDVVLCRRLTLWFSPFREQAGSQRNRGCIEHIVTLRLLIDYAFCKRKKLFIVLVDFSIQSLDLYCAIPQLCSWRRAHNI